MSEQEKEIRELVKSYYIDNPTATEEMIEEASNKIVARALEGQISIDKLKAILDSLHERKLKLEEIRRNYYKEVQHIEEVATSIGNVPTEVVEDFLIEQKDIFETITGEQLIAQAVECFKKFRKQDVNVNHEIPKIIEKELNSRALKDILTQVISNQSTAGKHSHFTLDGCYLSSNINKSNMVLGFVTDYIVIHQGNYNIDELYERIKATDINSLTNKELKKLFTKIIAESVQQKLGLEDTTTPANKIQIAEYVYDNFIKNGYCYQGTNAKFRDDITKKGLSSEFSRTTNEELATVDKIFTSHGLNKIFYSKLSETTMSPYYYTTESMNTAYFYSYHNPEYFSYFVASGNYMPDENYMRTAYYLRDYTECRNNLKKLCKKYLLSKEEQTTVMSVFEKLASELMTDAPNTITMVSRQLINKDQLSIDLSTLDNRSIEEIIGEIMQSQELSSGTKQYLSIPADKVDIISVPTLSEFYDKEKLSKETVRKFIPLKNGDRYYYDVLIHADVLDYDCISIKEGIPSITTIESQDSNNQGLGLIDMISCPQNITPDTLLSNGSTSFQSLQMMIAVNGKSNSPQGKKLIEDARKNYSPQYMSEYYYYLCDLCCRIAEEKNLNIAKRCQAILRMAKDFFPKAELMHTTGSYPEIVNEDKHLYSYLSYQDRIQVKEVESINSGHEKTVDNDPLEYCIELFRKKLEKKLNPEFKKEFETKMEQYGMAEKIENYEKRKQHAEKKSDTEYDNQKTKGSIDELNDMFESISPKKTESLSANSLDASPPKQQITGKQKIMQKKQESTSFSSSGNSSGISNLIGLIMIIISIVIILIAITII